jgi:hypothetical protein
MVFQLLRFHGLVDEIGTPNAVRNIIQSILKVDHFLELSSSVGGVIRELGGELL